LRAVILRVFSDSHETYGYRRVHAALQRMNGQAEAEPVRALMRELGLVPCRARPWRATTIADDAAPATPDLLTRDFTADAPGRKLVGDIIYVRIWAGFLCPATVIDCRTEAVVGWAMADRMKTSLISDALDMAARNIDLAEGRIFHSGRGSPGNTRLGNFVASSARWACERRSAAPASAGTTRWLDYFSAPSKTNSCTGPRSRHAHTPTARSSATSRCSAIENASTPDSATRLP
jgi:transposase InsO family protein